MQDNDIVLDNALEPLHWRWTRGWNWFFNALAMYKRAPIFWSVMAMNYFVFNTIVSLLPFVGGLLVIAFSPFFLGAWMKMARGAQDGSKPRFISKDELLEQAKPLLQLGFFYCIACVLVLVVSIVLFMTVIQFGWLSAPVVEEINKGDISSVLPFFFVAVSLFFIMQSTYFFAPALLVFRGFSPIEAMRLSLLGFWRNIKALILMYALSILGASVLLMPLTLLSALPLLQGAMPTLMMLILFFVVMPVSFHASFTSYMDIYENQIG